MGVVFASGLAVLGVFLFVVSHFSGDARLPVDCALVFGAAVQPLYSSGRVIDSQAGPAILRRVKAASDLYREGLVKRLYVSGGKGEGMLQSEAEVMRRLAVQEGVKPGDIVKEDHSRNTEENLAFARPLMKPCQTVVGVSDRYHLARIGLIARNMGWEVETYPAQQHAVFSFEAWSVVREMGAIAMYGYKTF
jgi:uncharacterized SAM-binding protein YcdF (DUF218 family)